MADPINAPHFTSARHIADAPVALAASIAAQAQTRELNALRTERDTLLNALRQIATTEACGHPASMTIKSAETGGTLFCEACDDKTGRRDAETMEEALRADKRGLLEALDAARMAIESMKQSAETAGAGGDEQMLQEACEEVSQEGLAASDAIRAAVQKWGRT